MSALASSDPRTGRAIALKATGMTKRFGAFTALDHVGLDIPAGQFHVLLGENGAGKSTVVKCIMGFYQPDEGSIAVNGTTVVVRNPRDARALGIGMVYQQFTLVPSLTGGRKPRDQPRRRPCRHRLEAARNEAARRPSWTRMPFRVRARRAGLLAGGRREAEARDPEAPLPRSAVPDPRRADLRADAGRSGRDARPLARHDPPQAS